MKKIFITLFVLFIVEGNCSNIVFQEYVSNGKVRYYTEAKTYISSKSCKRYANKAITNAYLDEIENSENSNMGLYFISASNPDASRTFMITCHDNGIIFQGAISTKRYDLAIAKSTFLDVIKSFEKNAKINLEY